MSVQLQLFMDLSPYDGSALRGGAAICRSYLTDSAPWTVVAPLDLGIANAFPAIPSRSVVSFDIKFQPGSFWLYWPEEKEKPQEDLQIQIDSCVMQMYYLVTQEVARPLTMKR